MLVKCYADTLSGAHPTTVTSRLGQRGIVLVLELGKGQISENWIVFLVISSLGSSQIQLAAEISR